MLKRLPITIRYHSGAFSRRSLFTEKCDMSSSVSSFPSLIYNIHLPIYAEWTLLPEVFGQVHFKQRGCQVSFYHYRCFIEIPVFNANSVDPDQTPHSAASDLGIRCWAMPILWDTRHKWVNNIKPEDQWS